MQTSSGHNPDTEVVHQHTLVKWSDHIVKRAATESAAYVMNEIRRQDEARQILEDSRANHRNLNRMLTLAGAFFIGLALTWLLQNPALLVSVGFSPATIKAAAPYTFVITILMDSSLAAYSFIRRY